jgi:DNA-binding transcriptional ArsR family regulator
MGVWLVSTDTLAQSRFVVSALCETVASVITLERGLAAYPGERVWLDAHRPAYLSRLDGDPVLPYWARHRRILEADVLARTRQLSQAGWAAALDDMRAGMRWLGDGRLQINVQDRPPRDISGGRLLFVPVTRRQGWVTWEEPHRYAVVYPCSGVLAEPGRSPAPEALGRLLGPSRAGVLVLLESPKSTSQLVALTGQGLGSVGRHLKVLLDAQLIRRRRAGRSVLYYRTDAGDMLIAAVTTPR